MTWPCSGNGLDCLLERLRRAAIPANRYYRTAISVAPQVDPEYAARFHAIYPGYLAPRFHPDYQRDVELADEYLAAAALELGHTQLSRMREILQQCREQYLDESTGEAALNELARALRAWLPFVSYAPFVVLDDPFDRQYWEANVPEGPAAPTTPELPADPETEDMDAAVDDASEIAERERVRAYRQQREEILLERYLPWRTQDRSGAENEPRQMALSSFGFSSDEDLKHHLYSTYPILLLFGSPTTPQRLLEILQRPAARRNTGLRALLRSRTQPLVRAIGEFRRTLRGDDGEVQWQRLRPITQGAKMLLLEGEEPRSPLHRFFDDRIDDMEPFTIADIVLWGGVVATVIIVLGSGGLALPAAAVTATIFTVDAAVLGLATYLHHLENQHTESMNSFGNVDAALEVASPQINLAVDAIFTGLSYLIPVVGRAMVRSAVVRRITARVLGRGGRATSAAVVRRTGGETVEATTARAMARGTGDTGTSPLARGTADSTATARRATSRELSGTAAEASGRTGSAAVRGAAGAAQQRAAVDALDRELNEMLTATMTEADQVIVATTHGSAAQTAEALSLFVVNREQQRVLGRILGRTLNNDTSRSIQLAVSGAHRDAMEASAARMGRRSPALLEAELQAAEARAASIVRRIRAHWDAALPPRASGGREGVVSDILRRFWEAMPERPNRWIREHLFANWRQRAMRRIGRDADLVADLQEHAGIVVAHRPGSGRYSFRLRTRTPDGRTVHTWLDVDHARVGHAEAVIDAYESGNPQELISTIASENLQLLTARENQTVIEAYRGILRRIDALRARLTGTGSSAGVTSTSTAP